MSGHGSAIAAVPPTWVRGRPRLVDGVVELDPATLTSYSPTEEGELLYDLAAVRRPIDALAFAKRYGLLRVGPGASEFRERFADWEETALLLRGILRLNEAVQRALSGDGSGYMDLNRPPLRGLIDALKLTGPPEPVDVAAEASVAVASLINLGLEGVSESVTAAVQWSDERGNLGPAGQFLFTPQPRDLVGYAYHQLALAIVNRAPMSVCPECSRVFGRRHGLQRYCTKQCSGRVRARRHADRKSNFETKGVKNNG